MEQRLADRQLDIMETLGYANTLEEQRFLFNIATLSMLHINILSTSSKLINTIASPGSAAGCFVIYRSKKTNLVKIGVSYPTGDAIRNMGECKGARAPQLSKWGLRSTTSPILVRRSGDSILHLSA